MTLSVAAREADTQADCETDSTDVDRRVDEHFARAHMCTCARAHACMHACARTSQTLPTAFPPYTTEKAYFESLKICEASIHPSRQASHSNPNPFNCSNTGSVSCHLPHLTGSVLPSNVSPSPISSATSQPGYVKPGPDEGNSADSPRPLQTVLVRAAEVIETGPCYDHDSSHSTSWCDRHVLRRSGSLRSAKTPTDFFF